MQGFQVKDIGLQLSGAGLGSGVPGKGLHRTVAGEVMYIET